MNTGEVRSSIGRFEVGAMGQKQLSRSENLIATQHSKTCLSPMQREQFYLPLSILKKTTFALSLLSAIVAWVQNFGNSSSECESRHSGNENLSIFLPIHSNQTFQLSEPSHLKLIYHWVSCPTFEFWAHCFKKIHLFILLFTWCSNGHNQSSGRSQSLYSHTRRAWWHFLSCSCPCGIGWSLCGWRQKYVSGICFEKWSCFPSQGFSYLST